MGLHVDFPAIVVFPEVYERIQKTLERGIIGQGPNIEEFEEKLARWLGVRHCIAVASGTAADSVAVAAVKEWTGLDKALVPALTFTAHPNSLRYNDVHPIFLDVKDDMTMDLRPTRDYGKAWPFPSDILGRPYAGTSMIEDACEALGSRLRGAACGTLGRMGTFSFFVSHTITTGEGGAVVTNDDDLARLCRSIRSHGRLGNSNPEKFSHPHFGFNAKWNEMAAAVGIGLVDHLDELVDRRREAYQRLNTLLMNRYPEAPGEFIVPHAYPLRFESETARDAAMTDLGLRGVQTRRLFSCLPTMEGTWAWMGYQTGDFPVAEWFARHCLYIPCHQNLTAGDCEYMAEQVLEQKGLI